MTRTRVVGAVLGVIALVAAATPPTLSQAGATAASAVGTAGDEASSRLHRDHLPGPLAAEHAKRRAVAQQLLRSGEADANGDGVVQLADDKWVEAEVTGTAQLFSVLVEFGDGGSPRFGTAPGPRHNEIPQPDRATDTLTIWASDFNTSFYDDLYFGADRSLAAFYTEQSSGRYTVDGLVHDWVQLADNEASYGDNVIEDAGGLHRFVSDSIAAWSESQTGAGGSSDDVAAHLAAFDVWDRWDFDADGDFDEPDGYVDHPQFVHAGVGEETGGGAQGADAIWSRFLHANPYNYGVEGPTVNGTPVLQGGVEIGDTGVWVGESIVVPENVGVGVLAHEYAHDLGLPDFYNYIGTGYNGVGFWSLMSLGSYLGQDGVLGTWPGLMGPWEKMQLGWLDYQVAPAGGAASDHTLSPAATAVAGQAQALVVDVPDEGIPFIEVTPTSGQFAWWGGSVDWTNTTLTRPFDLTGLARPTLTAKVWHDIEAGYDYLRPEYSLDGGTTWSAAGSAVTGSSHGQWSTIRYSLPAASLLFRFRYETDPYIHLTGAFIDDIAVSSGRTVVFSDDVESGDNGWAADGFTRSEGAEEQVGDRYYLLENRTYAGADVSLRTGPFNYGRYLSFPNLTDFFTYPDGLLVWMVDETYLANETFEHPGHGLALPVDARPAPILRPDDTRLPNHLQVFDAAFGLHHVDEIVFRSEVAVGRGPRQTFAPNDTVVPASAATAAFDDSVRDRYWSADNPSSSTLVAGHGVVAAVASQVEGGAMTVTVTNP